MKTKISLKDVVVKAEQEDVFKIWDQYCEGCRYLTRFVSQRCSDCKMRIAPPTRWRGKK